MKLNPILLTLGIISLSGCGGSSDSSSNTSSTYSVKAIDGYLRNAQVWLDIDGDYQLDDNEPSAITGEGGLAELDINEISTAEAYSIVVKAIAEQTIDEDTITDINTAGSVITKSYILSAPPGQTIITPISSLIHIKMKNGLTETQAITELAQELNIIEDNILSDYIENDQGSIAAKASSIVALTLLPESAQDMLDLTEGTKELDDLLTETTLANLSIVEENQLLIADDEGNLNTIDIVSVDDLNYDPDADGADKDGDGIINLLDEFPENSSETADNDADSVGNNSDAFPDDATETVDTDGDNVGDNSDAFPNDPTETVDTDGDNIGDNSDPDANGDGIIDVDEAGFEYADIENKRLYALYPNTTEDGTYYNINTMLFNSASEDLEFGFGYIDIGENYFRDSMPWVITDGSLILEDYNIRYKLIESTSDYFKVCYSGDITTDATCDDASSSYLFFDKVKAKSFVSNNSTAGTSIALTQITDANLNEYFTALEFDYAEQVYNVNIEDSDVESLAGMEQFTLLEKLWSDSNHITDISPLNNFSSLKYLLIADQTDPETGDDVYLDSYSPILTMPALTRLQLSEYGATLPDQYLQLTDIINGLNDKSQMVELSLPGVEITTDDISAIIGMPNLEILNISETESVDDFTALEANTWDKLERLELSWNNDSVIGNAESYIERAAALPLFNLDNMIASGLNLSQLTRLDLTQTTLDDSDVLTIVTNVGDNLERLQLRDLNITNYDSLFANLNTPNLTRLDLGSYNTQAGIKINYDMGNINNNLTPSKIERLYLIYGNISNFDISEFTSLERLRLSNSDITDSSTSTFNNAISQLNNLDDLIINGLTINGEYVFCSDLTLSDSIDCDDD